MMENYGRVADWVTVSAICSLYVFYYLFIYYFVIPLSPFALAHLLCTFRKLFRAKHNANDEVPFGFFLFFRFVFIFLFFILFYGNNNVNLHNISKMFVRCS